MAKFMFGQIKVSTVEIEAEDRAAAVVILKVHQDGVKENKKRTEYVMAWSEEEDSDTVRVRNGILAQFLNLIQNVIPTIGRPVPTPQEKSRIVLPFQQGLPGDRPSPRGP